MQLCLLLVVVLALLSCNIDGKLLHLEQGTINPSNEPDILLVAKNVSLRAFYPDIHANDNEIHIAFLVQLESADVLSNADILVSICAIAQRGTATQYIPDDAYLILATHYEAQQVAQLKGVRWVGYLPPQLKVSRSITDWGNSSWWSRQQKTFFGVPSVTADEDEQVVFVVSLVFSQPVRTLNEIRKIARRLADEFEKRFESLTPPIVRIANRNRLLIELHNHISEGAIGDIVSYIAHLPVVHFIERRLAHRYLNRWTRGILQHGMNTTVDYREKNGLLSWTHGLEGEGQTFALGDSGVDRQSCYFQSGQIVMYEELADDVDETGHGTHVAGTLVGHMEADGSSGTRPSFSGMAPKAKLAVIDIGFSDGSIWTPEDLNEGYFEIAKKKAGASIHVVTWGRAAPLYTWESHDVDSFLHAHRESVVVLAAGNDGSCHDRHTINTPATSKNGIAVGASMSNAMSYAKTGLKPLPELGTDVDPYNENDVAVFSSRGPTLDGRVKPDLVAPGYFVLSANTGEGPNDCHTEKLASLVTPNAGTSMAAPAIAGHIGLIRQYLMEGYYPSGRKDPAHGFIPSGSLLKAMSIASGQQMRSGRRFVSDVGVNEPSTCPNIGELVPRELDHDDIGWGRMQLDTILHFEDEEEMHKSVSSGDGAKIRGLRYSIDNDALALTIVGRQNKSVQSFGDAALKYNESHEYHFCIHSNQPRHRPVKIVLTWTDVPATLGAKFQLVNDLDLSVQVGTATFYGNSASKQKPDRVNPVEVVEFIDTRSFESPQDMTIRVSSHRIAVGEFQSYSIVLRGLASSGKCHHIGQTPQDESSAILTSHRLQQQRPSAQLRRSLSKILHPWYLLGAGIISLSAGIILFNVVYRSDENAEIAQLRQRLIQT